MYLFTYVFTYLFVYIYMNILILCQKIKSLCRSYPASWSLNHPRALAKPFQATSVGPWKCLRCHWLRFQQPGQPRLGWCLREKQ